MLCVESSRCGRGDWVHECLLRLMRLPVVNVVLGDDHEWCCWCCCVHCVLCAVVVLTDAQVNGVVSSLRPHHRLLLLLLLQELQFLLLPQLLQQRPLPQSPPLLLLPLLKV